MLDQTEAVKDDISKLLDGSDVYAEYISIKLLINLMDRTDFRSPTAYNLCNAMETHGDEIKNFPCKGKKKTKGGASENYYVGQKLPQRGKVLEQDWTTLKAYLEEKKVELESLGDLEPPAALQNMMQLAEYMDFSQTDRDVLQYIYCLEQDPHLSSISSNLCRKEEALGALISVMFANEKDHKKYSQALSAEGKFQKYGLMYKTPDNIFPGFHDDVVSKLAVPDLEKDDIIRILIGSPANTELEYEDFAYMGAELDMACEMLKKAVSQGEKGVNILLYGPAGGGKSELSKVIAKKIGLPLFSVGEEEGYGQDKKIADMDEDYGYSGSFTEKDNSTTGKRRLGELLRAQSLLSGGNACIVHFDEIEDLLMKGTDTSKSADTESKIAINRLFENNPVPVIWNGNDPEKFHQAVRDRVSFSIYMDHPPIVVRRKIWERQANIQKVDFKPEELDQLAREYDASPRKITLAIKAAKLTGKGIETIEMVLPASARITTGSRLSIQDDLSVSGNYDEAFSNLSKGNEGQLATPALLQKGKAGTPFSLFVQGPKGSGLKSYTRFIAEKLSMNPLEYSMEDLATPTQQSTPEMHVMSAFANAIDRRRLLCINDIEHLSSNPDSLTAWSRDHLVNVFAAQARTHKLPFAVTTTKSMSSFPEALTALFSDNVTTGFMNRDHIRDAFRKFFQTEVPEGDSHSLKGLVVSDFVYAQKSLIRYEPGTLSGEKCVELLKQQERIRMDKGANKFGFQSPHSSAHSYHHS